MLRNFLMLGLCLAINAQAAVVAKKVDGKNKSKGEVLDNPTLKAQSGALSKWSFYSTFVYKGGSLDDPKSAERPNITDANEKPNLTSISGVFGIKYRVTKTDNLSFTMGAYMAAPFHSEFSADDPAVQAEFDENHQDLDVDDPRLSYFKTYYLGPVQNVTFLHYELTTRGALTDKGYHSNIALSNGSAIRLNDSMYLAGTFAYAQAFFDKDTVEYMGFEIDATGYQVERTYKAGLSLEYYPMDKIALRAIADIASYYQVRADEVHELERRDLKQTLAMSYFYTRDIVIAPNVAFNINDIRLDQTNFGVSFNVNL